MTFGSELEWWKLSKAQLTERTFLKIIFEKLYSLVLKACQNNFTLGLNYMSLKTFIEQSKTISKSKEIGNQNDSIWSAES